MQPLISSVLGKGLLPPFTRLIFHRIHFFFLTRHVLLLHYSISNQKLGSKRLFLLTNEDDPHRGDITLRSASRVRAKDLQGNSVTIELFDIDKADKPDEPFDRGLYYKV
jgi:hypothetical protein